MSGSTRGGRVDVKNPDEDLMQGFPNDGDPYPGDDPAPNDPPADPPEPESDPYAELSARLAKQEEELARLRSLQTPPQLKTPPPPPTPPEPQEDFDTRFFRNPRSVLEEFGKEVEARVEKRVRSEYQQVQQTQKFWSDFYKVHPDLEQDHDLVEVILNSNLGEMSSMSVKSAMDRLADLTRERILRYAGGAGKPRAPKPKVEGASPPAPPKPKPTDDKILSISELIRKRKEDRRRAASGV